MAYQAMTLHWNGLEGQQGRTDMDYKELIENHDFSSPAKVADWIWNATCAITDLLARAEAADARCKTLKKMVREYQDVIVPGYRERAEKAERERNEAVESICMRCSVLPCRKNECHWYRFKKEE